MKNTKNKCCPFLAELLKSLGFAEAEYNFLKYSACLPLAFLLFPFSPNRRGGGIWQLLEYMFRICLLKQFSWSLDRNAFSLKDWNYDLSERIWINMRWMLGLCLLLPCFVFLIRINQSSQNDWLVKEQEWAWGGMPPVPCCDFTLLTKSNPQHLQVWVLHLQVWVSHFPSISNNFQVWWGYAQSGFLHVLLYGSWKAADIPSFQCLCTLCPKNVLHFLSCTLQWLSVPAFYFPSAHGKLSSFPHEAHANAGTPKAFSALQREHCFPVRLQTAS